MHEYDIALKTFLRGGRESLLALTSVTVDRWHNVELPEVRSLRVDLLGESLDGRLIHIELQSTHDATMSLRMMEYTAAIWRKFGRFPEQVVLYVGEPRLRMTGELRGPNFSFNCRIVDIREIDGERLLASERIEDNVLAVLARVHDPRQTVERILSSILSLSPSERDKALAGFLIVAGLRRLGKVIEQEASRMPILEDILDHEVLGREFKRGMAQGELTLLVRQIEKRFGAVPSAVHDRLTGMSVAELETAALRLLDARTIDDVLL